MEIELHYRGLGARIIAFGSTPVVWGFRRPERFGAHELLYHRLGTRLTALGPFEIEHDLLGSRPIGFGRHPLVYGRFPPRLRGIGPFAVGYGMRASRITSIGPFQVSYDRLGTRPRRVRALDPHHQDPHHQGRQLDDETAAMLFLVITVIRKRQTSSGASGAG